MEDDKPPPPWWFIPALCGVSVGGVAAFAAAPICTAVALSGLVLFPKPWDQKPWLRGSDRNDECALCGYLLCIGVAIKAIKVTQHARIRDLEKME